MPGPIPAPPSTIHCWLYALRPLAPLNARSGAAPREGSLLRVGDGYGCLHPWPELGDPSLDDLLAELARGEAAHPLAIAALECARIDGEARRSGRSLFTGPVPESHWLVRDGDDPDLAVAEGFSLAKIKGGPELDLLARQMDLWGGAGLRLRLDFNESLRRGAFLEFWRSLGPERRELFEAVEDPEQWSEPGWMDLRDAGVPVAVDRDHASRLRPGDVLVHKPALDGFACPSDARFYVTSYMDHALGQAWAAACASAASIAPDGGRNERLLPCGLLTHRCYEPDPFFERLRCDGPRLLPPGGTGLGFDDLLESLPWKRLS